MSDSARQLSLSLCALLEHSIQLVTGRTNMHFELVVVCENPKCSLRGHRRNIPFSPDQTEAMQAITSANLDELILRSGIENVFEGLQCSCGAKMRIESVRRV